MNSDDSKKQSESGKKVIGKPVLPKNAPFYKLLELRRSVCWSRVFNSVQEMWWDFSEFGDGQLLIDRSGGIKDAVKTVITLMAQIDSLLFEPSASILKLENNENVKNVNVVNTARNFNGRHRVLTASQSTQVLKEVKELVEALKVLGHSACNLIRNDKAYKSRIERLQYLGL